ncbi:hypothetical protein J6590_052327 [Homalodisca vitripennis]|nr:hypothetical protein J6590_052327 [Homalodisca vitripennis]
MTGNVIIIQQTDMYSHIPLSSREREVNVGLPPIAARKLAAHAHKVCDFGDGLCYDSVTKGGVCPLNHVLALPLTSCFILERAGSGRSGTSLHRPRGRSSNLEYEFQLNEVWTLPLLDPHPRYNRSLDNNVSRWRISDLSEPLITSIFITSAHRVKYSVYSATDLYTGRQGFTLNCLLLAL